jgi:hypothetical protein
MRKWGLTFVVLTLVVSGTGCKSPYSDSWKEVFPNFPREPLACDFTSLTKEKVAVIAVDFARRKGCELSKYQMPKVELDEQAQTWSAFFIPKEPSPIGADFTVAIYRQTKQVVIWPGK